jgi:hypothetical protein
MRPILLATALLIGCTSTKHVQPSDAQPRDVPIIDQRPDAGTDATPPPLRDATPPDAAPGDAAPDAAPDASDASSGD